MTPPTTSRTIDVVPLAERMRHLRLFRAAACVLIAIAWTAMPNVREALGHTVLYAGAAWIGFTLTAEALWRVAPRRALWAVGLSLMVDGVFLAWLAYLATPTETPLRHLLLAHLIAVCLLASFRTGLRLAMWHSLLLLTAFHAQEAGLLGDRAGTTFGGGEYRHLIGWIVVLWVVAVVTCGYGAINERELRRRRFDLEALGRLSARLEQRATAAEVAAALADAVVDDFGCLRVAVLGHPGSELELLYGRGVQAPDERHSLAAGRVLEAALEQRHPLLLSRLRPGDDPAFDRFMPDARNVALVPMHADGDAVGVLVCEHDMRPGSRIERRVVAMLERYAAHTTHALRNAWLVEQLERSATTDALTGVANRRTFDADLARALSRAARSGEPVTLVVLDVDHFKTLNDTFGHLAGDAVLRALADALDRDVRIGDTFARYGGEEFAVILPGLDEAAGLDVAERMRRICSELDLDTPITVSAGVATFPQAAGDALSLVAAADRALYHSKASGRNRCSTASTIGRQASTGVQVREPMAD